MYILSTPAGTLRIAATQNGSPGCQLWCDDRMLGSYDSANSAARAVSAHRTADARIDALTCALPTDVEGWKWRSIHVDSAASQQIEPVSSAAPSC
jgi:hypothetical protein